MEQADNSTQSLLQQGIKAAQAKRKPEAYQLLSQVVRRDPQNEQAWLWLAAVAPTPKEAMDAFERVLAINPANEQARFGQRWAQGRLEKASGAIAPAAIQAQQAVAPSPTPVQPPPPAAPATPPASAPAQSGLSSQEPS